MPGNNEWVWFRRVLIAMVPFMLVTASGTVTTWYEMQQRVDAIERGVEEQEELEDRLRELERKVLQLRYRMNTANPPYSNTEDST